MALYNHELNAKMKIFSQLYVGLRDQGKDSPKLGFATPFEKGSAFEKRKVTVDNWAKTTVYDYETKQYKKPTLETTMVDNDLQEGFRVTDDVKRVYWGGGNVVWRVFDPRGFELEIPSANLMAIIQVSGIGEGGLIPGRCCWGRDVATNILLHEKSDVYLNAIKNAEDIKKAKEVHSKERIVGAKYVLQSGDTGVYLGKFRVHSLSTLMHKPEGSYRDREYEYHEVQMFTPSGRGCFGKLYTHEILDEGVFDAIKLVGQDTTIHFYRKAPLISLVDDDERMTEKQIQKVVDAKQFRFAASGKYQPIIHVAREVKNHLVFALKPMDEPQYKHILEKAKRITKDNYYGFNQLFYEYRGLPCGFTMGAEDDTFWQHGGSMHNDYPRPTEEFFCATQWDEKQLKIVRGEYCSRYSHGPLMSGVSFKTVPVPSKDDVTGWLTELYENGFLCQIIVTEKVS
jgi:hypothetical protein